MKGFAYICIALGVLMFGRSLIEFDRLAKRMWDRDANRPPGSSLGE